MSANTFLDTNIVIYLYSEDEPDKNQIARHCINTTSWISTQVLNELNNVLRRKYQLSYAEISPVLQELEQVLQITTVSLATIKLALVIGERYAYSYFDSLMLASALELGCEIIYSEDMQHGQLIENTLRIINPFNSVKH